MKYKELKFDRKELIEELSKKDSENEKIKEIMHCIFYRYITIKEADELLQMEEIKNIDIPNIIKSSFFKKELRKLKRVDEIKQMNFYETVNYIDYLISSGFSTKDVNDFLYMMWDRGKLTGFDYRYTIDVLGEDYKPSFENLAKKIGRYVV